MYKSMSDSCYQNYLIMDKKIQVQEQLISSLDKQIAILDSLNENNKKMQAIYDDILVGKDKEIKTLKSRGWILTGIAIITTVFAIWR